MLNECGWMLELLFYPTAQVSGGQWRGLNGERCRFAQGDWWAPAMVYPPNLRDFKFFTRNWRFPSVSEVFGFFFSVTFRLELCHCHIHPSDLPAILMCRGAGQEGERSKAGYKSGESSLCVVRPCQGICAGGRVGMCSVLWGCEPVW